VKLQYGAGRKRSWRADWAKPGGTKFSFKFKPRYGINAQTPASIVYDYYNPDAQAMVAPLRFVAK